MVLQVHSFTAAPALAQLVQCLNYLIVTIFYSFFFIVQRVALSKLSWSKSITGFSSGLNCFLVRLPPDIVYQVSAIGISPFVQENDILERCFSQPGFQSAVSGEGGQGWAARSGNSNGPISVFSFLVLSSFRVCRTRTSLFFCGLRMRECV